ncbi:MAG: hypothetical protein LH650_13500 [Chloroflexi bacterium]|nr:hypothetical protein [Chloroflexota bacterium]
MVDCHAYCDGGHRPRPIKQLGPQAQAVIVSYLEERAGTGVDTSGAALEFPCGRRSCLLYTIVVDTPPAGRGDRTFVETLGLAGLVQKRARKLPPTKVITLRP